MDMDTKPLRIEELTRLIQVEYLALPGLRLTLAQAQRLWGLDRHACNAAMSALVDAKFLWRANDGRFARADMATPAPTSSFGPAA